MKKAVVAVLCCFMVVAFANNVYAENFHGMETLGQYEIPEDFAFRVSDTCSGHDNFLQAHAREDGWFAVQTVHTDRDRDLVYKLRYVDLYDSEGNFVKEFSFFTTQVYDVELTENALILYAQTNVISYDLNTGELAGYKITPRAPIENGLLSELRSEEFTAGQWTYSCKKSQFGYVELSRTNGEQTQVLLTYDGADFPVLPVVIWVCVTVTVGLRWKHKKKNNQADS